VCGLFQSEIMKKKTIIIIAAAVVCALIILLCCLGGSGIKRLAVQGADITVQKVSAYSGAYFEDGSDEQVENIMCITVKNNGTEDYQLVDLTVTDKAGNAYTFRITTLLKGETMTVLESGRAAYVKGLKAESITTENVAVFEAAPTICDDVLTMMASGNSVTVCNDSDKDLNNIYVYYKSFDGDVAVGGITYRFSVSELPAGESATVETSHFDAETSRFVFVTYAE